MAKKRKPRFADFTLRWAFASIFFLFFWPLFVQKGGNTVPRRCGNLGAGCGAARRHFKRASCLHLNFEICNYFYCSPFCSPRLRLLFFQPPPPTCHTTSPSSSTLKYCAALAPRQWVGGREGWGNCKPARRPFGVPFINFHVAGTEKLFWI